MLLDFLSQYLRDVEAAVRKLKGAYVERYEEEIVAVIGETGQLMHLGYRYHFQDKQNNLIFRYDNTPHFPGLEGFPHHKHLSDKVAGAEEPSILKVIEEAKLLA